MTVWTGVVATQYGAIVLVEPGSPPAEDLDFDRYFEEKCASIPGGVQISVPEQNGDVPTEIRVLERPRSIERAWEHVAEIGLHSATGRFQLYSWLPDEDLATEIEVPRDPLVARIHWGGLEAWLAHVEAHDHESAAHDVTLRIDLMPGAAGGVRTLRTWHEWAPVEHESVGPTGLRVVRGTAVASRRAGLELSDRTFWPPYPTTHEGSVHALGRDPGDGSRWALGSGRGGPFLQELSPDEAARLEAESFQRIYTYARDADGRIWAADQMPLERVPALQLVSPDRWAYLQELFAGDATHLLGGMQLVDLPPGWSRITRRELDGTGRAELVVDIEDDGSNGLYQRWPDDAEIPS